MFLMLLAVELLFFSCEQREVMNQEIFGLVLTCAWSGMTSVDFGVNIINLTSPPGSCSGNLNPDIHTVLLSTLIY